MYISMCDVGDGLNLYINHGMMVDYGGDPKLLLNKQHNYYCFLKKIDTFVLSHFHKDHYNGLFLHNTKLQFWNLQYVYYQGIPEIIDCQNKNLSNQFFAYLMAMNHYLLGDKHGLASVDLINRLAKLNRNSSFQYAPLFEGDNFHHDGITYEVLWPPKKIKCDETIVKIKNAINAFNKAKRSNPKLKELAKQYNSLAQKYTDEKNEKETTSSNDYMKDKETTNQDFFEENFSENILSDEINEANNALRKAANDLSLAFKSSSNELLFLGDLEKNQINSVCQKLNGQFFDTFIAPHHGTHFGYTMKMINANIILSSVGEKLYKFYLKNIHLQNISKNSYCTYKDGCLLRNTLNNNQIITSCRHKII